MRLLAHASAITLAIAVPGAAHAVDLVFTLESDIANYNEWAGTCPNVLGRNAIDDECGDVGGAFPNPNNLVFSRGNNIVEESRSENWWKTFEVPTSIGQIQMDGFNLSVSDTLLGAPDGPGGEIAGEFSGPFAVDHRQGMGSMVAYESSWQDASNVLFQQTLAEQRVTICFNGTAPGDCEDFQMFDASVGGSLYYDDTGAEPEVIDHSASMTVFFDLSSLLGGGSVEAGDSFTFRFWEETWQNRGAGGAGELPDAYYDTLVFTATQTGGPVPEPGVLALFGIGLGIGIWTRRRYGRRALLRADPS